MNCSMAVLRNGKISKITEQKKRSVNKRNKMKFEQKSLTIKLKRLSPNDINLLLNPPKLSKYNLRSHNQASKLIVENSVISVNEKQLATISKSNLIWNQIINRSNEDFHPTQLILAKMSHFRPWPARINSVFKVGNVEKCNVFFMELCKLEAF